MSSFEIYESRHEQMRGKANMKQPLTVSDLKDHLERVHTLGDRLRRFLNEGLIPTALKIDVRPMA
jgi:hypothetical protein